MRDMFEQPIMRGSWHDRLSSLATFLAALQLGKTSRRPG